MGVKGLWKLLDPAARPVSLESLSGKILAVDVSIWLNKAAKGMRDSFGNPVYNAHLLLIFSRICKLLFYGIKPIFVFDGGVPALKKKTLAARRDAKYNAQKKSKKTSEKLLKNYLKSKAVQVVTGTGRKVEWKRPPKEEDLFLLPDHPTLPDDHSSTDDEPDMQDAWVEKMESNTVTDMLQDTDQIDFTSSSFTTLPAEVQHELLVEMKDSHRHRHYKVNAAPMPEESDDFSSFQLKNLLKRGRITRKIDEVRQTMNSQSSGEVMDQYGGKPNQQVECKRIASDDTQHYILIKTAAKGAANVLFDTDVDAHVRELNQQASCHPSFQKLEREPLKLKDSSMFDVRDIVTVSESSSDENSDDQFTTTDSQREPSSTVSSDQDVDIETSIHDSIDGAGTCTASRTISPEPSVPVLHKADASHGTRESYQGISVIEGQQLSQTNNLPADDDREIPCIVADVGMNAVDVSSVGDTTPDADRDSLNQYDVTVRIDVIGSNLTSTVQPADNDIEPSLELAAESTSLQIDLRVAPDAEMDHFISTVAGTSKDGLISIQDSLEEERRILEVDKQKRAREATSITNEMYKDVQALLALFGIPYIVSPQEAEAQCAVMDALNITNGSITDDSDIFLFGARTVYRNVFNSDKYAECHCEKNIKSLLNLDRQGMIAIAMLTGSDYTDGIQGVGGVTAFEILHGFGNDPIDALVNLKKWHDIAKQQNVAPPETKLKTKLRAIELPRTFPSHHVIDAYMQPLVDTSEEPCEWGKPDLDSLRLFAGEKLGWSSSKADEMLLPILKQLNKSTNTIDRFMTVNLSKPVKSYSKRLQRVLTAQKFQQENPDLPNEMASQAKRPKPTVPSKRAAGRSQSYEKFPQRKTLRGKGRKVGIAERNVAIPQNATLDLSGSSSDSD